MTVTTNQASWVVRTIVFDTATLFRCFFQFRSALIPHHPLPLAVALQCYRACVAAHLFTFCACVAALRAIECHSVEEHIAASEEHLAVGRGHGQVLIMRWQCAAAVCRGYAAGTLFLGDFCCAVTMRCSECFNNVDVTWRQDPAFFADLWHATAGSVLR